MPGRESTGRARGEQMSSAGIRAAFILGRVGVEGMYLEEVGALGGMG